MCGAVLLFGGAAPHAGVAAPDPGGDPTADIALPTKGRYFGFNLGPITPDLTAVPPSAYAEWTDTAGGNMLRNSLVWQRVERRPDIWEEARWAEYETIYATLRSRGVTPFFTLGYAPLWARDAATPCTYQCPPAPAMLPEWKEFVSEVARRFPAAVIGVWNEPNLIGGWGEGALPVDPARFTQLAIAAADAVRRVNPAQKVIAGGLGTKKVAEPHPNMGYDAFLEGMYEAGIAGHVDGIDFHVYPGSPDLGRGTRFARIFDTVRDIKARYGDQTKLWITEFGRTTSGQNATTQREQKQIIVRATRRMMTMRDVKTALVHRLIDRENTPASDPQYGFGLLHLGPQPPPPKKSYCGLVAEAESAYGLC